MAGVAFAQTANAAKEAFEQVCGHFLMNYRGNKRQLMITMYCI